MRADRVVLDSPPFDQYFCLQKRVEDLSIEQFISQLSVEGFDIAILPRAAWFDVQRVHELLSNSFPGMTWGYDAHSLFFKSVGSSNYNGNGGGSVPNEGWHIEFEISAANPVPEPATIAVWSVLGLCGIGYGVRRKMRRAA